MKQNGEKESALNKILAPIGLLLTGAIIVHGFLLGKLWDGVVSIVIGLLCSVIVPQATEKNP